jgi:hypothetical protein
MIVWFSEHQEEWYGLIYIVNPNSCVWVFTEYSVGSYLSGWHSWASVFYNQILHTWCTKKENQRGVYMRGRICTLRGWPCTSKSASGQGNSVTSEPGLSQQWPIRVRSRTCLYSVHFLSLLATKAYCHARQLRLNNVHTVLKPNSWTYTFDEVSEQNFESSQTLGYCTDFLNHREGGMVFYQVFLLSPLQWTVTELSKL